MNEQPTNLANAFPRNSPKTLSQNPFVLAALGALVVILGAILWNMMGNPANQKKSETAQTAQVSQPPPQNLTAQHPASQAPSGSSTSASTTSVQNQSLGQTLSTHDPNVLEGKSQKRDEVSQTVPLSELKKWKDRALVAEKTLLQQKKDIQRLEGEVRLVEQQIQNERISKLPLPPTPSAAILSTLAPILNTEGD